MSINVAQKPEVRLTQVHSLDHPKAIKMTNGKIGGKQEGKLCDNVGLNITKLFEGIEAEIDACIDERLRKSLVEITSSEASPLNLLKEFKENGFDGAKILKLNPLKFLISSDEDIDLKTLETKVSKVSKWFVRVRPFSEKDFIIPRMAKVRIAGLPMNAWVEENLKAFTHYLGEWVSWVFQDEVGLKVFNPEVTLLTTREQLIDDQMSILVKGKKYKLCLREFEEEQLVIPGKKGVANLSLSSVEGAVSSPEKVVKDRSLDGAEEIADEQSLMVDFNEPSIEKQDNARGNNMFQLGNSVLTVVPETELTIAQGGIREDLFPIAIEDAMIDRGELRAVI